MDKPARQISHLFVFLLGLGPILLDPVSSSLAQVPPITSSGLNTQVSGPISVGGQTQFNITGGTRPGGGTNLFHSFGNFNVPNNNIANFLNNSGLPTTNILGRVTGGNVSNILGTIQTTGFGNANLFLMNPAGFLFGPNATVNVGGMVSFTSADYLRLADGAKFNAAANANADALLSSVPVAAFGFLGTHVPGAITVQGSQLRVTEGTGISLIGGDIQVTGGTLRAPGGQINLASAASRGEVVANALLQTPNLNADSFAQLGQIQISQKARIDASGDFTGNGAGGVVLIRGGRLIVDDSSILTETIGSMNGAKTGISVKVQKDVLLTNNAIISTSTNSSGNAGDVSIAAASVSLTPAATVINPGTVILAQTHGTGRGGDISISASGAVTISGYESGIRTSSFTPDTVGAGGDAGSVLIRASSLTLEKDAGIYNQTQTSGRGGDITLDVGTLKVSDSKLVSASFYGSGDSGAVNVRADSALLTNAIIQSYAQGGSGNPAPVEMSVTRLSMIGGVIVTSNSGTSTGTAGSITIRGKYSPSADSVSISNAFLYSGNGPLGNGDAGQITISAKNLTITDGAGLLAYTGDAFSSAFANGTGKGGNIVINAETLQLSNGAVINSDTLNAGNAGGILLNVSKLQMTNGGQITSSSLDTNPSAGSAGSVAINAAKTFIGDGSTISTTASQGQAGLITINAGQNVHVVNGSVISADNLGVGNAGSISIRAGQGFLSDSSTLSATAFQGQAGNISISARQVARLLNGTLLTVNNNGSGNGGNITITAPVFHEDISSTVEALSFGGGQNGTVTINGVVQP